MMKLMVLFLGLLGAAFAFASGNAESARDAALIARVKSVPVAKLDAALPALPFEQWLVVEAGKDASFRWEVNDCGEQTGAPGQNPDEIPTCVEADASLKDGPDVVDLQVHPVEPFDEPVAGLGRGSLASAVVVLGAAEFDGAVLTGRAELDEHVQA